MQRVAGAQEEGVGTMAQNLARNIQNSLPPWEMQSSRHHSCPCNCLSCNDKHPSSLDQSRSSRNHARPIPVAACAGAFHGQDPEFYQLRPDSHGQQVQSCERPPQKFGPWLHWPYVTTEREMSLEKYDERTHGASHGDAHSEGSDAHQSQLAIHGGGVPPRVRTSLDIAPCPDATTTHADGTAHVADADGSVQVAEMRPELGVVALDHANVDDHATIESLPNELLIATFLHLDPATVLVIIRAVCRRWNQLFSSVPRLYLDLMQLDGSLRSAPSRRPARLAWRYRFAAGLTFRPHEAQLPTWVATLIKNCPGLTTIKFGEFTQLTDECLLTIAKSCSALTELSVRNCSQLTDVGMIPLAQCCPQLSVVDLSSCCGLSAGTGVALSTNCRALTSVNCSGCKGLVGRSMAWPIQRCPRLQRIDVSRTNLNDNGIRTIARHCPELVAINLNYCPEITSESAIVLGEKCPRLSVASFNWSKQLSNRGIEALAKGCPELTAVSVRWCSGLTDPSIEALVDNCPRLTLVDHVGTSIDPLHASSGGLGSERRRWLIFDT